MSKGMIMMRRVQCLFGMTIAPVLFSSDITFAQGQPTPAKSNRLTCLVGYPDGSFRGDLALTRYEFVAGMAACLDKTIEPLQSSQGEFATKSEMETVLQQQQQMNDEVKKLLERVNNLSDD